MKTISILLTLCVAFFSAPTFAEDAGSDLIKQLEKINTYSAQFEQNIRDANGEQVAKSHGKMIVERPGKFYWKSQSPDPILVVADGKFLWTYDIDLAQVTKQDLNTALGNSPATLLAGKVSDLNHNFKISYAPNNTCKGADKCFVLHPTQKEAAFADILISVSKGKITDVRMRDSLGQNVHTRFSQVQINSVVNKKVFAFVPPKGVDVIQGGK
jgi:outer membrane lipoprotein carrier protein